jgi:hypothetical protein
MSIINWELWHRIKGANIPIVTKLDPRFKMKKKTKIQQIVRDWQEASPAEVWEGVRDNFLFGFIGATLVVFIATRTDLAVFIGYITYYFYMGRIVNRPKYVTDLGKLVVFPIPSALGAFTGYKLSYLLIQLTNQWLA